MITKNSIENLKNYLDIVDVISQFIEIKKSGANYKACCPFHGEKTPSFVISPAKQIYHCFGCGVGGDSIKFIMEYEKLSYPEAIEKLASMYNVSLTYENNQGKKQETKILQEMNLYYQKLFVSNDVAKKYLEDRGISNFSIEKFEIGYAPSSAQTINYIKDNFLSLADAKDLGVIDNGENGLYARQVERITFPIFSLNGTLVGFGGRTITGHNAKYINSPQTRLFNKSKLLYGYNLAKEQIYKKKEIIVTEGYLDTIMLHQAGFDNAVATLGTALTVEHLPLLKRGEPKIILAYDGDNAGLNAAYKASVLLSHSSFEGGVVIFDQGIDPADMVANKKIQELNQIFANQKPFVSFVLDFIISKYDLTNPQNKQKALNETNDFLKTLSPIFQEEYKRYLASKLGINEKHIKTKNERIQNKDNNIASKIDILELGIIKSIANEPKRLEFVLDIVNEEMFEHHKVEFQMLLNDPNNPKLMGLLLNEKLETYDDARLNDELKILLIKFYEKKLFSIKFENIEHKQKINTIVKIRDNISQLKKGKLVSYNLF